MNDYVDPCSAPLLDTAVKTCQCGAENGLNVALIGDSHAAQWVPALTQVAPERKWTVTSYIKSRPAVTCCRSMAIFARPSVTIADRGEPSGDGFGVVVK